MVVFWNYTPYDEGDSLFCASQELHDTSEREKCREDLLSQSLFSTASSESAELLSQSLFSEPDHETGPTEDKEYTNDEDVGQLESTITFKCMGATKNSSHQNTLQAAEVRLAMGNDVPVKLEKEPDNPRDKNAIAFVCCIDEQWKRIGYMVAECTDEVNRALTLNKITKVRFAWVRYILHWPRCGPGTYAGINITKRGTWSDVAHRAESTI